ncbi:cephalosporin hydroxylase family protein [Marichromatium sp. PS1]|uniref:cephalosporin hydroxylase family protein n=1 Tax=Marichromatium sp. PS1 TaxID=3138932 RepID=UPI0034E8C618
MVVAISCASGRGPIIRRIRRASSGCWTRREQGSRPFSPKSTEFCCYGHFTMKDDRESFIAERTARVEDYRDDGPLQEAAEGFMRESLRARYSYQFDWLGLPIIQYPQDVFALQEIIWTTRPDVIIETGIARGGSLIFSASMLALLDLTDAERAGVPVADRRRVVGIDLDIRAHNRQAVESHPLAGRIEMVEGDSTDPAVLDEVRRSIRSEQRVMVCLDSSHTHDHVVKELDLYAPLVTPGCYCAVFDTVIEEFETAVFPGRPWSQGNNPMTAVRDFLARDSRFEIDASISDKLLLTVARGGFLKRVA